MDGRIVAMAREAPARVLVMGVPNVGRGRVVDLANGRRVREHRGNVATAATRDAPVPHPGAAVPAPDRVDRRRREETRGRHAAPRDRPTRRSPISSSRPIWTE